MRDWRKRFPKILQKIIEYNSRLIDKVERFLADPIIDPETTLYGELQQGLRGDISTLRSLCAIEALCTQMRDISVHLEQLSESYNESRRDVSSPFPFPFLFASHRRSSY